MAPEEFDDQLRAATGPSGGPFDLNAFKRFKDERRYREVLEELANREVILRFTEAGRPILFRTSIWMYIYYLGKWLMELYRVRDGIKLKGRETYGQAATETLLRGEMEEDQGKLWLAAQRGFRQEFQLDVEQHHLDFNFLLKMLQRIIVRESSVYPGFISSTLVYPVVLDLGSLGDNARRWEDGRMVWDTNKIIRCEWREWLPYERQVESPAPALRFDPIKALQEEFQLPDADDLRIPILGQ